MEETLFFVLGLSLTALALIVSFVGLKMESFPPSKPALVIGVAVFALLVGGTAAYAWMNGEEEQKHRNAEIAAGELLSPQEGLAEAGESQEDAASEDTGPTDTPPDEGAASDVPDEPAATAAVDGAAVFMDTGCAGCHTLADAGSTATTGPDLDAALKGQDADFIRTSIVDPNQDIAEGYPPAVMPQNYESELSPEELDALVEYLVETTSGSSG